MTMILCDFDEVLAHFRHEIGFKHVSYALEKYSVDNSWLIANEFAQIHKSIDRIFHGSKNANLLKLKNSLNSYRITVPESLQKRKFNFMWSRQLWLRYLSDKHEINLDGKTISKIIESFWMSAAGNSKIDPKTEKWIKDNEKRLFIITGSDRNLIFRAGKIIYNSKYSKRIKIKRMKAQGLKIQPRNIITGDPYDKDTREFWQNISKRMPQDVIVIDDSTIIVSRAKNCGFRSFLFDPDGKHYEKSFKNRITDLTEISRIA